MKREEMVVLAGKDWLFAKPDAHDFGRPRVRLCHLPTPVEPMEALAEVLGIREGRLVVKRDDETGLAFGGNKLRKLEYLCADAIERGARHLVTGGALQSNHCRQTAAAASKLGLDCTVLLIGEPPARPSGNFLLDLLFGAKVRWIKGDVATVIGRLDEDISAEANRLTAGGDPAYPVVVGGSVPLGALGYVRAGFELQEQVPDLARVFCPEGSAGTHAGLAVGLGDLDLVYGVELGFHTEAVRAAIHERIERLALETAELAGLPVPKGHAHLITSPGGEVEDRATLEAIRLAARTEGLVLDPTYTGKAMAGLIAEARAGTLPDQGSIVFVHTGGTPGLLADEHSGWLVGGLAGTSE